MMEVLYEMVSVFLYIVQGVILAWYAEKFATPRFVRHRFGKYYIIPAHILLREGWQTLNPMDPEKPWTVMERQLAILLLLYLCVWAFYKSYAQMYAYISVSFLAISEMCIIVMVEILQIAPLIFNRYVELLENGRIGAYEAERLINHTAIIIQFAVEIIYAVILWLLIRLVTKNFRFRTLKIENTELLFLISPALTGMVLACIFRGIFYSIEDGVPKLIYDKYPFLYFMIPLVFLLILSGIMLTILSYQKIARKNEEAMGARLLKEQMAGLEEHFKELERTQEDNRRLRHDIKNIVSVLKSHREEDAETAEWKEFLEDVSAHVSEIDIGFSTGNAVMDSLISMKFHEAMEKMPDMKFTAESFLLPDPMKIRIYDLSIIIGNALDNAIEACTRVPDDHKRFIELSSVKKKGMLLIHIRNSFDGRLILSPGERFPKSLKDNPTEHGIGMENMERIADRYYGGVSFEVRENEFDLHVMLQDREPVQ